VSTSSLILCADDYALSPGVIRGILDALAAGRINATGAMTNRPLWKTMAREVAAFTAQADIGLHLNFTFGAPIGGMPKLAPSGDLPQLRPFLKAARAGTLPREEIRAEIARQLDAFEEAMGHAPAFIDGHQHVQVFPIVREALLEEAVARGYAGKVCLRDSSDGLLPILRRRVEVPKALVLAWLGRDFARQAAELGFLTNDSFAGFSSFDPTRDYGRDFARYLRAPGKRHLIMCHPGHLDEDKSAGDEVTLSREHELSFLLSDDFTKKLEAARLELSLWSRVPRA
jgi:hypothetical protein